MDEKVREAIKNAVKGETFAQALNMKLIELEDGHSVVEIGDHLVGRCGDDRAAFERGSAARGPAFPEPGEGKCPTVLEMNEVGAFAILGGDPLIETVRRDQASASLDGGSKRRLLGDRLCAGIDHLRADCHVLRPGGDQTPADHLTLARLFLAGAHDRNVLGRGDIETRLEVVGRVDVEDVGQNRGIHDERESSTHTQNDTRSARPSDAGCWIRPPARAE